MIIDSQNELSDAQAVTASAISTNVIDLGGASQDIGAGEPVYMDITCIDAVTAGGSATLTVTIESDSTADLATSATVHFTTVAIPKASLTAGAKVARVALPRGDYERYLGVRFTVGTGPLTAGTFSAALVNTLQDTTVYPAGYTIS